ncbi:MAG: hypothetical protein JNL58_12835 [Planctomyces sp.]|nr:hypothetical protein [Planctomyces sp.]
MMRSVRWRIQAADVVMMAVRWGSVTAIVSLLFSSAGVLLSLPSLSYAAILCLVAGTSGVLMVSLPNRPSWIRVAECIDQSLQTSDDVLSAFSFVEESSPTIWQRIHIEQTLELLKQKSPIQNLSVQYPSFIRTAGTIVLVIIAGSVAGRSPALPTTQPELSAAHLSQLVSEVEHQLSQLPGMINTEDQTSKNAMNELRRSLNDLRTSQGDSRRTLLALSKMQRKLIDMESSLIDIQEDRLLQQLGEALEFTEGLEEAGRSLQSGDYSAAAQHLASPGQMSMSSSERATAAQKLSDVAEAMRAAGMSELPETVQELASAVKLKQKGRVTAELNELSAAVSQQAKRTAARDRLRDQQESLTLTKQSVYEWLQDAANTQIDHSGDSQETRMNTKQGFSGVGGSGAGQARSDQLYQQQTSPKMQRQLERLRGQVRQTGNSEREQVLSTGSAVPPHDELSSTTPTRQLLSESPADAEFLPADALPTIRRYFKALNHDAR